MHILCSDTDRRSKMFVDYPTENIRVKLTEGSPVDRRDLVALELASFSSLIIPCNEESADMMGNEDEDSTTILTLLMLHDALNDQFGKGVHHSVVVMEILQARAWVHVFRAGVFTSIVSTTELLSRVFAFVSGKCLHEWHLSRVL